MITNIFIFLFILITKIGVFSAQFMVRLKAVIIRVIAEANL